jgi:hypothetical protein
LPVYPTQPCSCGEKEEGLFRNKCKINQYFLSIPLEYLMEGKLLSLSHEEERREKNPKWEIIQAKGSNDSFSLNLIHIIMPVSLLSIRALSFIVMRVHALFIHFNIM